jgi:hypothetical protein
MWYLSSDIWIFLIIIFLLSYVLLRMPIRSTMKGDSTWGDVHSWQKIFNTLDICLTRHEWRKTYKIHRTRELPPYANSHEWHFAKHIALVCAGLYIWLIIAIDIQTLYNLIVTQTFAFFRNLIQHTHNSFATHIPFFDNLTRIYTLWLFILWELFPRGSSMYDAHYSHLPRLVDHKSTHKLPLRTYIPSYLLKC